MNKKNIKKEDELKQDNNTNFCLYSVILGDSLTIVAVWQFFFS